MSWFLAFAGFAVLIILHELGHFTAAKMVGMRVERFALFFPPLLFKVRRGETEYGVGAIPLGGYVRITGMNPNEQIPPEHAHRAYYRQPVWKRVFVIAAGPFVNVVVAFLIFIGLFLFHGVSTGATTTVDQVTPGSPAAAVLQPGDTLTAVDGKRGDFAALTKQIRTHTCAGKPIDGCAAATPAQLTVDRDGRTVTFAVTPRYDAQSPDPAMRIGYLPTENFDKLGLGAAAERSVTGMWNVTEASVSTIGKLFYDSEARDQISGVVGNYERTRQTFEIEDWVLAIQLLGLISLSLAVVNLFPFLPLDGGHIFWAVAEKLRGRPISFQVMERASVVGFVLVIMLFALGLTNDIDRLRGEGFGIR